MRKKAYLISRAELSRIPVKRPDVVAIRNVGTQANPQYVIDITEVVSEPGQTQELLDRRIHAALDLLPEGMQGKNRPILP